MSTPDSLHNTIGKATKEVYEESPEQMGGGGKSQKYGTRLIVLAGFAVILLLIKFVLVDGKARQLKSDIAFSALDLFMEADGSVVIFYMNNGVLPQELPEAGLGTIVEYNRLDAEHYSLQVLLEPHDTVIERSALEIAPPANIEQLLNL